MYLRKAARIGLIGKVTASYMQKESRESVLSAITRILSFLEHGSARLIKVIQPVLEAIHFLAQWTSPWKDY